VKELTEEVAVITLIAATKVRTAAIAVNYSNRTAASAGI
jgi:hypothetical protein